MVKVTTLEEVPEAAEEVRLAESTAPATQNYFNSSNFEHFRLNTWNYEVSYTLDFVIIETPKVKPYRHTFAVRP